MLYAIRLLKLAKYLEALPESRWDFSKWVGANWQGAPDLSCGTTACALGHAASMPEFRALGAGLEKTDKGMFTWKDYFSYPWDLGEKLFGLNFNNFSILFEGGPNYPWLPWDSSAKDVARHIKEFVMKGERNDSMQFL